MLVRLGFEDIKIVLRDTGSLLKWSSVLLLAPILIALWFRESFDFISTYILTAVFCFLLGIVLKKVFYTEEETGMKHAFTTVALSWILFTAISAFPFVLITGMTFVDSMFEVMSALTTTGLSMMGVYIDSAPASLIFWRSLLSWIGGVGIIVLALMGILTTYTKSSKLMIAEGHEDRIRPNLKNTAKEIWMIYALLTVIAIVVLFFAGMDIFSSINYAMSAISTTGMDTTSTGLAGGENSLILIALGGIMLVGATSFSVHYMLLRKKHLGAYLEDTEVKALVLVLLVSVAMVLPKAALFYGDTLIALEIVFFHNISALTCGGFYSVPLLDINLWDDFMYLIILILMVIGGSSGSTAGGIKLSRFVIFSKSVYWKVKEAILPKNAIFQRNFEGKNLDNGAIREVNQFILLYFGFILLGVGVLTFQGIDLRQALFEVISAQGNVGLSIGVTNIYMPLASKIALFMNMWIGRLEIIPLLSAVGFALSFKKD